MLHCIVQNTPSDWYVQCFSDVTGGLGDIYHKRRCNNWLNYFNCFDYLFTTMISKIILVFEMNDQYLLFELYVKVLVKDCN